jgi:predicted aconitase
MQPLGQRLLRRGIPVALIAAAIGFVLTQGYRIAEWMGATVVRDESMNWLGPVLFGVVGFLTVAALECVRKPKQG